MSPGACSDGARGQGHSYGIRRPLERLLWGWLERGRAEVVDYVANNGKEPPDPTKVAAACPALGGRPEVAAWHLRALDSE